MVVERSITFRHRFEFVVKVNDNLGKRHIIIKFHTVARHILLLHQFAALAETERHDVADKVGLRDNRGANVGFFDVVDFRGLGHTRRIVHLLFVAVLVVDKITYVGHSGDDVHVELAVEAFLHYFHVEQSEEAAAEAEAEGNGTFGRKA